MEYKKIGNSEAITDIALEVRNYPDQYLDYEYKESKDITTDICNLIKASVKYKLFFRVTAPKSKKQTAYIDLDNRVKLLTENNNNTKGNSQIQLSRLKYIIAYGQKHLSILAIIRILNCRSRIKLIDIDHWDNNTLNNLLSNLRSRPHTINISSHYDHLKRLADKNLVYKAKEYAKDKDVEYILPFVF